MPSTCESPSDDVWDKPWRKDDDKTLHDAPRGTPSAEDTYWRYVQEMERSSEAKVKATIVRYEALMHVMQRREYTNRQRKEINTRHIARLRVSIAACRNVLEQRKEVQGGEAAEANDTSPGAGKATTGQG